MPRRPVKERGTRWGEGYLTERPQTDRAPRWQARWSEAQPDGSVRWRAKTFDARDAAEDHLRAVGRAKRDGRYAAPSELTVAGLIAEHLDRAADRLSPRTVLTYRARAEAMIAPHLGTRRVADLATLDIQRWIDALSRSGFRPATVHAAVAVLTGALRDAAVLGVIERNPATGIRRPGIRRDEIAVWSEAEARTVLGRVAEDPIFGALYHVALSTGMRPGELRALAWRHVDLDRRRLTVCRTVTKDGAGAETIVDGTKRGRSRTVALTAETTEVLRRHRIRQAERRLASSNWQDHGLVFDRGDGHWIYQSAWFRAHRALCAACGVPAIRAHDLRHTFATLMLARNVHPKVVSEILGHASIQITLDLYSHVSIDMQDAALAALSEALTVPAREAAERDNM